MQIQNQCAFQRSTILGTFLLCQKVSSLSSILFVSLSWTKPACVDPSSAAGSSCYTSSPIAADFSQLSAGKGQGKGSFIVMEYLDFGGSYSQADFGQRLAEMHKAEPAVNMLTCHCSLSACMACTCSPPPRLAHKYSKCQVTLLAHLIA